MAERQLPRALADARLVELSQRCQRWYAASAEITAALLEGNGEDSLALVADWAARLSDADLACIALPGSGTSMTVVEAHGDIAPSYRGLTFDAAGTLAARAHEGGQPVLTAVEERGHVFPGRSLGPTMAIPFVSFDVPAGVLTVSRRSGGAAFTPNDLELASDFAAHASIALRLASSRADRARVAVLEDRGRIARDLHDHVIQRLFGAGLSLQVLADSVADPVVAARVTQQVDSLDAAIDEIRSAIFTLTARPQSETQVPQLLRRRIADVLGELADSFAECPRVVFGGAVDLVLDRELADDVVAVVREGLTNVARHAEATVTSVNVAVSDGRVVVTIEDDGHGIRATSRSSGTANLHHRAAARRGTFSLGNGIGGGAVLLWDVPLEETRP